MIGKSVSSNRSRLIVGAVTVVVIVAAIAVAVPLVLVGDGGATDRHPSRRDSDRLLSQADFPSGYVVSALTGLNTWQQDLRDEMSSRTDPETCRSQNIDEITRNKTRVRVGVQAQDPLAPTRPGYTETISHGGESLRETMSVVAVCPRYTRIFPGEGRTVLNMASLGTVAGCPEGATVLRSTTEFTPEPASGESRSSSTALDGYVGVADSVLVVSQVQTLPGANLDTAQFCEIAKRAVQLAAMR